MRRRDRAAALGWSGLLLLLLTAPPAAPAAAAEGLLRHEAPITIQQPGPFVRLPLGVPVYARSLADDLADLRVVDARGERTPFALLQPRADDVQTRDRWREAARWRLPPRPAAGGTWASPVDVTVEAGGRVTVRQRGATTPAPERSPGWLFDLGERAAGEPAPARLTLAWSGPAEFSAGYALEHSADLRQWARAGSGQVMALSSPTGALTQPDVALPAGVGRFLRLVWLGAGPYPALSGARTATPEASRVALEPASERLVAASPEPAGPHAGDAARRSLHFDLGARLPLVQLELRLPEGTRVLPAQLQGRDRAEARWEPLGATVFYRIERPEGIARPPAFELRRSVRFIRIVPDERAAAPEAGSVRLVVQARLASLVFASQGQAPWRLRVGAASAAAGALPVATLVPDLERVRASFGSASLGEFSELREAAEQARSAEQQAAWRPRLLWAVLVAGVAALGFAVWRLARPKV